MTALWQGLILGFSIAAPVGPIGLLCIRKTLIQGRLYGLLSGLGAATADGIYGAVAALGLTIVTGFLVEQSMSIQLAGALFLIYLALRTFRSPVRSGGDADIGKRNMAGTYLTTLILTLTNPMTILSFAGIFAGMNISVGSESSALLVAGVFAGSAFWWLLLALGVGFLRKMISVRVMRGLNYFSGLILLGFAVWSIYNSLLA